MRRGADVGFAGLWDCGGGCLCAARYKPVRVNNRPSDVIAPRDTSVAFKWLLSRLCLDADVDLWNSIKLYGIPYRPKPGRRVSVVQPTTRTHVIFFHACAFPSPSSSSPVWGAARFRGLLSCFFFFFLGERTLEVTIFDSSLFLTFLPRRERTCSFHRAANFSLTPFFLMKIDLLGSPCGQT